MVTMLLRAAALAMAAAGVAGHINMASPPPLEYKGNPYAQHIDYDIKSPLTAAEYPCHGALGEFAGRGGTPVAAWTPGQAQTVRLEGTATHNGGSCQLSLSYDGGRTFTVLYSKIGGCPTDLDLAFTLPADAPAADRALLAWTWNNHSGNREFYMNCASVQILGGNSRKTTTTTTTTKKTTTKKKRTDAKAKRGENIRRRAPSGVPPIQPHLHESGVPWASRPQMLVANLFNTTGSACVAEGHDLLYPQPGPDYDDVSTTAALPFDCVTGQTIPFGGGTEPVASSSSAAAVPLSSSLPPSSSSVPYESSSEQPTAMTSSSSSSAASATTATTATSAAMPTGAGGTLTGPCSDEGVYNCIGGTSFQRCASGQWSAVQPMAPGTQCAPGLSNGLAAAATAQGGSRRQRRRSRLELVVPGLGLW